VPDDDHAAVAIYNKIADRPNWLSFVMRLDATKSL
jgi:hypothetical protein